MLVHFIIYLECFPDPGVNKNEYNDYIVALQKVSPYNQKCTGLDDWVSAILPTFVVYDYGKKLPSK